MEKPISHSDWIEQFKPIMDADNNGDSPLDVGFYPTDRRVTEAEFQLALDEGRVWTLVDADPYPLVVSGAAYVNRLEYYICEVAVPEGTYYHEIDED